jgi:phosphotransferase system  glucose/maltose/N-acetylglucosamine-specific IIC component
MSIVALIIAPLIKGKEAWETWYYGMIPIGIMLFGTYFVYYSFWRDVENLEADKLNELVKKEAEVVKESK